MEKLPEVLNWVPVLVLCVSGVVVWLLKRFATSFLDEVRGLRTEFSTLNVTVSVMSERLNSSLLRVEKIESRAVENSRLLAKIETQLDSLSNGGLP